MIVHFEVFTKQSDATKAMLDYQIQKLNVRVVKTTELVQFAKDGVAQNPSWSAPVGQQWFVVIATDEAFTVPPALPTT